MRKTSTLGNHFNSLAQHAFPLVLCLLLASCFDHPDYTASFTSEIVFSASIDAYATRTTQDGSGWAEGDEIGVYTIDAHSGEVETNYANIRYSCSDVDDDEVSFSCSAGYELPDDPVSFVAYYPYTTAVTGTTYPVRLADQSAGTVDYDLMYAATTKTYNSESLGSIPLEFTHKLARLVFQFSNVYDQTVYANNVSITGMNTSAYLDLLSGELYDIDKVTRMWCYANEDDGQCEVIVLPTDIDSTMVLNLYVEKELFTWNFTATDINLSSIEAGYVYTFSIPLDTESDGIAYVDVDDGFTGEPWDTGGSSTGVASALKYDLFPTSSDAYRDTELRITFDSSKSAPTVGSTGTICIYRQSDGQLCDSINLADECTPIDSTPLNTRMDIIGQTPKDYTRYDIRRVVNYYPVLVDGYDVVIKPHQNKLDYDTKYYVLISSDAISHSDFSGISNSGIWTFETRSEPDLPADDDHTVTVSHDEADAADFYSVQGAIDFLVVNYSDSEQKTVYIHDGVYEELLFMGNTDLITLEGESRDGTIIEYNNYNNFNGGTGNYMSSITEDAEYGTVITASGGRAVLLAQGMEMIYLKNLTLTNSSGNNGQAEALSLRYGTSTKCYNCIFNGYQDTLYLGDTYVHMYGCLVTGAIDFIWGAPTVALFEACELQMVAGGEMFQPRSGEYTMGFVVMDCTLTRAEGNTSYANLVRTFGSAGDLAFIRCAMEDCYFEGEGWGDTEPSVGSGAYYGFRYYDITDMDGNAQTIPGDSLAYALTDDDIATYYASRSVLLAGYGDEGVAWFLEDLTNK